MPTAFRQHAEALAAIIVGQRFSRITPMRIRTEYRLPSLAQFLGLELLELLQLFVEVGRLCFHL
jgi:hypothetical protein